MFKRFSVTICAIMALLFLTACSGQNFVVVRDGSGPNAGKVLGMRTVADVRSFAPTDKLTWLEHCDAVVTRTLKVFTSTDYVNCQIDEPLLAIARNNVSTGYVAGIAGPVLQAGAILGGAALIGNGISKSGSQTTNTNNTSGGSANANAKNSNSNHNTNVNANSNHNDNTALGGHGGNGGNGGNGGIGGNGGSSTGCFVQHAGSPFYSPC